MFLEKINKTNRKWFLLAALFIALIVAPQVATSYTITLLTLCLIFSIFAMSLDLLAGYMGHASLGHASFFGVGAYAIAVVETNWELGFALAVPLALLVTLGLGLFFGLLVSNLSGVQFVLVNLALGQVVWGIAYSWYAVTGGDDGIRGISRPVIGDLVLRGETYYYFTIAVFLLCVVLLFVLVNSPFGQSIRGIKQSQSRMRVLGYNVWLHKYITYVIAGLFAGLAGILLVYFNRFIGPTSLEILASARGMLMVLVGGAGTLIGPIIGATFIVLLENFLSAYTERWVFFMGFLYVVVVLLLPRGIYGLISGYLASFFGAKEQQVVDYKDLD